MAMIAPAPLAKREMQFVYQDGDGSVFMDPESDEQIVLPRDRAGEMLYLKEGMRAHVLFQDGRAIGLQPPGSVELSVTDTDPVGDGRDDHRKQGVLETGLKVFVAGWGATGAQVIFETSTHECWVRAELSVTVE